MAAAGTPPPKVVMYISFTAATFRDAPVDFGSGDEVSAVDDRHTHSGNVSNGVVRFLCKWKALMAEAEPLCPLGSLRRPCSW